MMQKYVYIKTFLYYTQNMNANEKWVKPDLKDLGEAKDIIKNVFRAGTGDTEPGMVNILASSL